MSNAAKWKEKFNALKEKWRAANKSVAIVTAEAEKASQLFPGTAIIRCDATVIKTAARVNPTCFLMSGSRITNKVPLLVADEMIP
ncbi:hypothetical protein D3C72_2400210 [compost metagenome]